MGSRYSWIKHAFLLVELSSEHTRNTYIQGGKKGAPIALSKIQTSDFPFASLRRKKCPAGTVFRLDLCAYVQFAL